MRRATRGLLGPLLVLTALAGLGCPPPDQQGIGYDLPAPESLLDIERAVFIQLSCPEGCQEISEGMTEALFQAIQEKRLFQLQVVRRDSPALEGLALDGAGPMALKDMSAARAALGCNAVLLGSISYFQPHPRMKMSLLLRLVDLRRGRLLWGVDHTWDAADLGTEYRIREHFNRQLGEGSEPAEWRLATMSPRAFERFVAYEVANCLPSRGTALALRASMDKAAWRTPPRGNGKPSSAVPNRRQ